MARNTEKHVAGPRPTWQRTDPFGLKGYDLCKEPLGEDEIPAWFAEMHATLEDRWEIAERSRRSGALAKELEGLFGRTPTSKEARDWYDDARQDHRWCMRLLDDSTSEGKLYRAYMGLRIDNGFFHPDPAQGKCLEEVILFLLDLEDSQDPFSPPFLKGWQVIPGRLAKSKTKGKFFYLPMEGFVIPRRYGKARAQRLLTNFLDNRSKGYWKETQDHLRTLIENPMKPYRKVNKLGLLPEAIGSRSARLVTTIRDPMLSLVDNWIPRDTALTIRDLQRAVRLYRGWLPLTKKYLRLMRRSRAVRDIPDDVIERIRAAQEHETQPMRITLLMILKELSLGIGVDTLRRRLRPHLR